MCLSHSAIDFALTRAWRTPLLSTVLKRVGCDLLVAFVCKQCDDSKGGI